MLNTWSNELNGILLNFSDVRLASSSAPIDGVYQVIKLPVTFRGVVFSPAVDQRVEAVVEGFNQEGINYIFNDVINIFVHGHTMKGFSWDNSTWTTPKNF
jgi:hypothetical protein